MPLRTLIVEGWGLYAESLGEDLGLYKDPYSKFGRLQAEIYRACRLVVDTGMHAMGWTRQQAIDYMKENSRPLRRYIETEVDRYIVWPGQALGYKIGELKIKELRTKASKKLGRHSTSASSIMRSSTMGRCLWTFSSTESTGGSSRSCRPTGARGHAPPASVANSLHHELSLIFSVDA